MKIEASEKTTFVCDDRVESSEGGVSSHCDEIGNKRIIPEDGATDEEKDIISRDET